MFFVFFFLEIEISPLAMFFFSLKEKRKNPYISTLSFALLRDTHSIFVHRYKPSEQKTSSSNCIIGTLLEPMG